jgi:dipeptide/tripeptide permease
MPAEHIPYLFAVYGIGLAAVFIVFALLYRHAYRNRDLLKLTDIEAYDTRDAFNNNVWVAIAGIAIGATSALTGLTQVFKGDAGQLVLAAVEILVVIKILRVRTTRRKRREKFLAELSARTATAA